MVSACHHTHLPLSVSFNYRLREHFKGLPVVIYDRNNCLMMAINRFPLRNIKQFEICLSLQNCYSGNYLKERLQHLHKDSENFSPIMGNFEEMFLH